MVEAAVVETRQEPVDLGSIQKSLFEMRGKLEGSIISKSEFEAFKTKIDSDLTKACEVSNQAVYNLAEQRKQMDNIEKHIALSGNVISGEVGTDDQMHHEAFHRYLTDWSLTAEAFAQDEFVKKAKTQGCNFSKSLTMDKNSMLKKSQFFNTEVWDSGELLLPVQIMNNIAMKVLEISNIRKVCNVIQVTSKTARIPVQDLVPTAFFEGEQPEVYSPPEDGGLGAVDINLRKMKVQFKLTQAMINNSPVNLESYISDVAARAFAKREGEGCINGQLTNKLSLSGILQAPIQVVKSQNANTFDWKALQRLYAQIKFEGYSGEKYDRIYVFNRRTFAELMQMSDGFGRPIWQDAIKDAMPATISGVPYLVCPDMPDISSGSTPVVCGDFMRGYTIADQGGVYVYRNPYREEGNIFLTFIKYIGSAVVLNEAFAKLKIQA